MGLGEKARSAEISGRTDLDLLRAGQDRRIVLRDVLEVTASNRPANEEGKGSRAIYLGPSHGDPYPGNILFYIDLQDENAPKLVTERGLTGWKKVGEATPEEWDSLMKEIARKETTERTFP